MKKYNHQQIEPKWQKYWEEKKVYKTSDKKGKPKFYVLDMFPYPSGAGLHVGHPKGYIATDVVARMKMMQGYNVLHPMGWDAFGLPAENYAIKNKVHPRLATQENIKKFKSQLEKIGFTYDWSREINTTDPKFYKWTQRIFLEMFKRGLAYESYEPINWCPSCKTGLANEDLEGGRCERCGSEIERKPMRQWVLKITKYADRLLEDLEKLPEWEESIKEMQRSWIGRSEGALVKFKVKTTASKEEGEVDLEVFTTRPDTLFGATYLVLAPEHELIKKKLSKARERFGFEEDELVSDDGKGRTLRGAQRLLIQNWPEVERFVEKVKNKTEMERTETKEKTGVKLEGIVAVNPVNNEELPIFVADYVLGGYGTGAIMAVPAHDERDWEFAQKYSLPIKPVVLKNSEYNYSFLMGREEISEDDLRRINIKIIEKTKDGFLKILIPNENIDEYKNLIREKMSRGFWNEFSTKNNFYFIFKHQDGKIEEFELNKDTNDIIDNYGMIFNDEEPNKAPKNVYSWLAENDFYKNLLIHTNEGVNVNSGFLDGLPTKEAKEKMIDWLEKHGVGKRAVNYRLQDWVFSRQRYWGEPIPLVFCKHCQKLAQSLKSKNKDFSLTPQIVEIEGVKFNQGEILNPGWVVDENLPVTLPEVESYEPTGTGESPLANIKDWVNTTCPKCGGPARRETNTMPQWAGSSWYYLRYIDPHNDKALVDKGKEKYWSPVDLYVGGAEHATRHLIYARFWHKFLYDIGAVNYDEPFQKLQHVGLILAEDGRKMSKRWGNVVNPDQVVEELGADTLRLYEMFMGPFDQSIAWSTKGLKGARRFLEKVWRLFAEKKLKDCGGNCEEISPTLPSLLHKTIKKVTEDIDVLRFNTAISQMMIFVNEAQKSEVLPKAGTEKFLLLLAPFAPHLAEEIWQGVLGYKKSIFLQKWPQYNPEMIKEEEIEMVIQVDGKVREKIRVAVNISEEEAKKIALESEKIKKWTEGKEVRRIIFVQGKLVNIVIN